jgi:multiple sugar transport system substrate-binding protein
LTGEPLLITARSLESFGDDVPQAGNTDLVLIDHPHVGRAAASGAILPIDDLLDAEQLEILAADSAGPSHVSYEHGGHQWAIAIDASCQALAMNASAFDDMSAPATWGEVNRLALAQPGMVALPLRPAHAISALLSLLATHEQVAGGPSLATDEALGWATETLATLAAAGPEAAFGWEPPEALARLAAGELLCVPIVYAYIGYDVRWCAAPALASGGRPGSILGGVGAAVRSGASDPSAAARFAGWLGSAEVQAGIVGPSGGQPASHSAWTAPGADPMYAAVLPTLEVSQVRPRDAWWPEFQNASGEFLASALSAGWEPLRLANELARLYRDHYKATE